MARREREESKICSGQCHPLLSVGRENLGQPSSPWACFCCMVMGGCPALLGEHSSLLFTMLVCSSPEQSTETCGGNRHPEAEAGVTEKMFSMQKKGHICPFLLAQCGWVCTIGCSITRHRLLWILTDLWRRRRKEIQLNSFCKDLAH